MTYNLYLDDIRDPHTTRPFVVVRSVQEAMAYVTDHGFPSYVSFDHDLADDQTGYDFAKWLVELDLDTTTMPKDFAWNVHSANGPGAKNIEGIMVSYARYKATL